MHVIARGADTAKKVQVRFIAHIMMRFHPRERLVQGIGASNLFQRIGKLRLQKNHIAKRNNQSNFKFDIEVVLL